MKKSFCISLCLPASPCISLTRRADLVMKKSTYSSRQYGAKLRML